MTCMRARTSSNFGQLGLPTAELDALERPKNPHRLIMGKNDVPTFFSAFLERILFILAGNDSIHERLDEFEIRSDPTTGFHGDRKGHDGKKKQCLHFFSAVFHPFLFILACNDGMYKSSDEFEFRPDWTTECGVRCP